MQINPNQSIQGNYGSPEGGPTVQSMATYINNDLATLKPLIANNPDSAHFQGILQSIGDITNSIVNAKALPSSMGGLENANYLGDLAHNLYGLINAFSTTGSDSKVAIENAESDIFGSIMKSSGNVGGTSMAVFMRFYVVGNMAKQLNVPSNVDQYFTGTTPILNAWNTFANGLNNSSELAAASTALSSAGQPFGSWAASADSSPPDAGQLTTALETAAQSLTS